MSAYLKFIVAVLGFAIMVLTQLYGPDSTIVQVVVGILTSLGVFAVPNVPSSTYPPRT